MSQEEINQGEWSNPKNWAFSFYGSRLDSRLFVSKRKWVGWELNFKHKQAKFVCMGFIALMLVPPGIALIVKK